MVVHSAWKHGNIEVTDSGDHSALSPTRGKERNEGAPRRHVRRRVTGRDIMEAFSTERSAWGEGGCRPERS